MVRHDADCPHWDQVSLSNKTVKLSKALWKNSSLCLCSEDIMSLLPCFQILQLVTLLKRFIDENPLCVCSEEINYMKKDLLRDTDEVKLKQKTSQVVLKLKEVDYHMTVKITVPDDYPDRQVE